MKMNIINKKKKKTKSFYVYINIIIFNIYNSEICDGF